MTVPLLARSRLRLCSTGRQLQHRSLILPMSMRLLSSQQPLASSIIRTTATTTTTAAARGASSVAGCLLCISNNSNSNSSNFTTSALNKKGITSGHARAHRVQVRAVQSGGSSAQLRLASSWSRVALYAYDNSAGERDGGRSQNGNGGGDGFTSSSLDDEFAEDEFASDEYDHGRGVDFRIRGDDVDVDDVDDLLRSDDEAHAVDRSGLEHKILLPQANEKDDGHDDYLPSERLQQQAEQSQSRPGWRQQHAASAGVDSSASARSLAAMLLPSGAASTSSFVVLRGLPPLTGRRDIKRMLRSAGLSEPTELVQYYHQARPKRELLASKPEARAGVLTRSRMFAKLPLSSDHFAADQNNTTDMGRDVAKPSGSTGSANNSAAPAAVVNFAAQLAAKKGASSDDQEGTLAHLGIGLHRRWGVVSHEHEIPRVFLRGGSVLHPSVPRLLHATGMPTPVGGWSLKWNDPDSASVFMERWRELNTLHQVPKIGGVQVEAVPVAGNFAHRRASIVLGVNYSYTAGRVLIISGFPHLRDVNVIQNLMRPFAGPSEKTYVQIVSEGVSPAPPDTVVALGVAANESEARRAVRHLHNSLFRNKRLTAYLLE